MKCDLLFGGFCRIRSLCRSFNSSRIRNNNLPTTPLLLVSAWIKFGVSLFLSFQACFVTVAFDYFSFWPTRSSLLAWMGTITEKRSRLSLQIVASSIQQMYAENGMSQRSLENSLQSVPHSPASRFGDSLPVVSHNIYQACVVL